MDEAFEARIAEGAVWGLRDHHGAPQAAMVLRRGASGALRLDSVAVHPGRQGQGLLARLLDHAEQEAREAGLERIELYTHARMGRNRALWLAQGFRVTGERTEHGFERLFFERRLDPEAKLWSD